MKHVIPIRIKVLRPLVGVTMKVQRGRAELLAPAQDSDDTLSFDFEIAVDVSSSTPNFLGPFAQGPKDARFIYVNSGTYAGQAHPATAWSRRAKLSLMSVTREQIEHIMAAPGARLETSMNGVGKDGGPTCASVKGLEWTVVKR